MLVCQASSFPSGEMRARKFGIQHVPLIGVERRMDVVARRAVIVHDPDLRMQNVAARLLVLLAAPEDDGAPVLIFGRAQCGALLDALQ